MLASHPAGLLGAFDLCHLLGFPAGESSVSRDLLDRMARNPVGGWRIADVTTVCKQFGASCAPPRGGGSHYTVLKPGKREILTIPFKRPIKAIYIKKLVAYLREEPANG